MSDDQRKLNAEAIMMKLATMMDLGDDDEDGDRDYGDFEEM